MDRKRKLRVRYHRLGKISLRRRLHSTIYDTGFRRDDTVVGGDIVVTDTDMESDRVVDETDIGDDLVVDEGESEPDREVTESLYEGPPRTELLVCPTRGRPSIVANQTASIYEGSNLSVEESAILILTFIFESKLNKENIILLLNLIKLHCPVENKCISSSYQLFKFLDIHDFVIHHRFCPDCLRYIGTTESTQSVSLCPSCNRELPDTQQSLVGIFIEFNIEKQLAFLLDQYPPEELISQNSSDRSIMSFMDGSRYRELSSRLSCNELTLTWAMDSFQPFKSSGYQITPFYLRLNELPSKVRDNEIICAGIWYGHKKPDCFTYLGPMIDKLNELRETGMIWQHQRIRFHVMLGCVDAVQKAELQKFHQFNGMFGCGMCYHPGKRVKKGRGNVNVYPVSEVRADIRTLSESVSIAENVERLQCSHINGVKGISPLLNLKCFDYVRDLPPDPLHQLYLGVMKHLFHLWFEREYHNARWYIGNRIEEIDSATAALIVPSSIDRLPRGIKERKHFRGHEFAKHTTHHDSTFFQLQTILWRHSDAVDASIHVP